MATVPQDRRVCCVLMCSQSSSCSQASSLYHQGRTQPVSSSELHHSYGHPGESHGGHSVHQCDISSVSVSERVLYSHSTPHLPFSNSLKRFHAFLWFVRHPAIFFLMLCHWGCSSTISPWRRLTFLRFQHIYPVTSALLQFQERIWFCRFSVCLFLLLE